MRHYPGTMVMVCLLLVAGCGDSGPKPGPEVKAALLSAVPAEAWGFAAAKNPQGIVDRFKGLLPDLEELEEPLEDPLAAVRDVLGDVDLSGPAALVVLDLQDFDEKGVLAALLVSAADAEAVVASHKAAAGQEIDLPEGVVKINAAELEEDLYLAAKGEFVIVALNAESAEELLRSESSLAVLPEVQQGYEQGKVVAWGDMARFGSSLASMWKEQMAANMAQVEGELTEAGQWNMMNEGTQLYFDIITTMMTQVAELVYIVDVNEEGVLWTEKSIPAEGSLLADFVEGHIGQDEPSYEGLPAGSFILAGTSKMLPEKLDPIVDEILAKVDKYPELSEKFHRENVQRTVADIRDFCRQSSGMAFTAGMGNMGTGMLSVVCRFDVQDAGAFEDQIKRICEGGLLQKLTETTGIELSYATAIENYDGVDIDAVRIGLAELVDGEPAAAKIEIGQQVMKVMPMVIGPDLSIRVLSPNDKQVFVIISGGYPRAERVVNVINGHGSSLADYTAIKQAIEQMPSNRLTEIHYDFGQLLVMIRQFAGPEFNSIFGGAEEPGARSIAMISGCVAIEKGAYREDVIIPADFVKFIAGTMIPAISRARGEANAAVCASNMHQLAIALLLYSADNEGTLPPSSCWQTTLLNGYLDGEEVFSCPSAKPGTENDYVFVPWSSLADATPEGQMILVFERNANHSGSRNVAFVDGHVSRESEPEFQAMLAKTIEASKAKGIEFNWQQ